MWPFHPSNQAVSSSVTAWRKPHQQLCALWQYLGTTNVSRDVIQSKFHYFGSFNYTSTVDGPKWITATFKLAWVPRGSFSWGQTVHRMQSHSESELEKQANLLFALQQTLYQTCKSEHFIFLPSGDNLIVVKTSPKSFTVLYYLRQKCFTIWKNTWRLEFHNNCISTSEPPALTAKPLGHGDALWLFFFIYFFSNCICFVYVWGGCSNL